MARQIQPGTPSRSPQYVRPAPGRRLTVLSLAGAGLVLIVGFAAFAFGSGRVASPGAVAQAHSTFDGTCVQCHTPAKAVAAFRCERCHDPLDAQRFTVSAHLSLAGREAVAGHADDMACTACHTDHRGRAASLQAVDDRRCVSCHEFGSFRSHPEVAAVRAKTDPTSSLDFSHEIHLRELAKRGSDRCEACHRSTPDRATFEPMTFDRTCAGCHLKDGLLTLNGVDTLTSGWTPSAFLPEGTPDRPAPAVMQKDERGRVILGGVGHRNAYMLAAADALARTLPTPALAHERTRLIDRTSRLLALSSAVPVGGLSNDQLAAWSTTLQSEIAVLDRQIAGGPSTPADTAAALGAIAGGVDPSIAAAAGQLGALPGSAPPTIAAADAPQVAARRDELTQLLDAIAQRAPGTIAARAESLKSRVAALEADSAAPAASAALVAGLSARLAALDEAVNALEASGGAAFAAEVDALRRGARVALTGGDAAIRTRARADLLALLDATSARTPPSGQPRVAELRSAVLALTDEPADLGARRAEKARLLDRIELERALRGIDARGPSDAVAEGERTAAGHAIEALNARLQVLDRQLAPVPQPDNPRGQAALKGLLDACLKCHRLNDEETAMRSVSPARLPLRAATFSHQPHLLQTKCESCHRSIETSKTGPDVNVPGIATCQSCHTASQAPAQCTTCHVFHPRSAAELVTASWH